MSRRHGALSEIHLVQEGRMRQKRKEWMGVVGALGLAAFLLGLFGGIYSLGMAIALSVSVWAVGATLVLALTDPPEGD